MKFLLTAGYFDPSCEGHLIEIDLTRETSSTRLAYTPPESLRVSDKGFTGAAWSGVPGRSTLFVCGPCAVHQVEPSRWAVTVTWHQRCWNDLHHVAVAGDRVYVVNTGLEAIDVLSMDGSFLGSHALHPGWLSAARVSGFSPNREALPALRDVRWPPRDDNAQAAPLPQGYYTPPDAELPFAQRKVRDYFHPNHLTIHEGRMLVTRFLDRAVEDVTSYQRVIEDTPGLPHDGLVDGDRFWITCVNGMVIAYAIEGGRVTGREIERFDVFSTGHTGWCRGLAVTRDHLVVGLTAIRRMPRYRWCDRSFEATETSVVCIERRTGKLAARVPLEGDRHAKIFSVLPC